ncbi:MAG TPA: hypothetical protein VGF55_28290 [Gemmataceae bacterium]|jgi:hypothetical protein
MAWRFVGALALVTAVASGAPGDVGQSGDRALVEAAPDPRRAVALDHAPTAADLDRLRSVEGKPAAVVLRVLGHPYQVERRPDGEEVWDYRWCAACRVWVRKGVCTGTFYTGGY